MSVRDEEKFREQMWGYAKGATEAYVRVGGIWHPTKPEMPLPPKCDGFGYRAPGRTMTMEWRPSSDGDVK